MRRPMFAGSFAPFAGWLALTLSFAPGCGTDPAAEAPESGSSALERISDGPHPIAEIRVKDLGVIRIELLPEIAPKTVANFAELAGKRFYDGTTFHRVIPDFMIQGGDSASKNKDPRDDGKGGPGYSIVDEFSDLPHDRGIVSMANSGSPNSGGSQFFIVHRDSPSLDGNYSAFGRIIEGIEVVDRVTEVEIDKYGRYGPRDRPYPVSVVMESVRVTGLEAPAGGDSLEAPAGNSPEPAPASNS